MIKNSIVLVPFPFDDFSTTKVRPAICLTSEIGDYEQIIIAFISSRIPSIPYPSDLILIKNSVEWENTGLIKDSVIRLHKIVTIRKAIIKRKIGYLDSHVSEKIYIKLNNLFRN